MAQIDGQLKRAQLELLADDPSDAAELFEGRIIFNTTEFAAKIYQQGFWIPLGSGGGGGAATTREEFEGDGSETEFVLENNPLSKDNILIFIGGAVVHNDEYEFTDETITFDTAPPAPLTPGTKNIQIVYGSILGAYIPFDDSVTTASLQDDAVTEDKLADDAVTEDKIADDAVTNDKILDGTISNAKLAGFGISAPSSMQRLRYNNATSKFENISDNTSQSSNSGSFSTTSTSFQQVTNFSLAHVAIGRPVKITLIPGNGNTFCSVNLSKTGGTAMQGVIECRRGSTSLAGIELTHNDAGTTGAGTKTFPPGAFVWIDDSNPTGSTTYNVRVRAVSGTGVAVGVDDCKMFIENM